MKKDFLQQTKNIAMTISIGTLILFCFLLFAGCGGTTLVGTWRVDRVVVDGKVIKATDSDKGAYAEYFDSEIVFNQDKTGTIKIGGSDATEMQWTQENKSITITFGDNSSVYSSNGAELTYTRDTLKVFYKMG